MKISDELDVGGLVTAVAMLVVSAWVLWESQSYTELAAVFPRTVALVLALASGILIVRCLMRLQLPAKVEAGSHLRRAVLVLALVGWVALIPVIGFFIASLLGFIVCGLTARYEPWPMRRWVGFVTMALAAVALFYGLFSEVLKVPFPRGWLL